MRIRRCSLVMVCVLAEIAGVSRGIAAEALGGSLALTSDSVYRGLSQTCGDPAAQADLHYRGSGGLAANESFIGVWGSAGLGNSPCTISKEVDLYAGYHFAIGQESSVKLTYIHYAYPGHDSSSDYRGVGRYQYDEVSGAWAYQDQVYLTVAFTPDAVQYEEYSADRDRHAWAYGAQWHRALIAALSASAGVGYDEILDPRGTGYGYWNAGFGYAWKALQLDLSYFQTATRAERLFGPQTAGHRVAGTVSWQF